MNNETILKMQKMRLPALIQNYREQLENPEMYDYMTFEERVTLMIDAVMAFGGHSGAELG